MGSTWRYIGRGEAVPSGGAGEAWPRPYGIGLRAAGFHVRRRFRGSGSIPAAAKREAQCAFEASHDARSIGVRGRRMRRPYIGAPRPVIPEPFVGPSNDGVGMNDSGRGMAPPLRNRVASSRIPRPPPLPRKREYPCRSEARSAKRNAHSKQVMTRAASGLADAACGAPTLVHPDR